MSESQSISYRMIFEVSELEGTVELQKTFWPQSTVTSMPQLAAAVLHGGNVVGAFDGDKLVGFCYGFPGYKHLEVFLASHMMVIHADYRDQGIGMRLKLEQRLWALAYGYKKIVWTFDPFETRNGYLNLCKLGGRVGRYISAFYGTDRLSLPTDRFLVEWDIDSDHVRQTLAKQVDHDPEWESYPCLLECLTEGEQVASVNSRGITAIEQHPGYLMPIPGEITRMKQAQLPLVAEWQAMIRQLCTEAFSRNYRIVSLIRRKGPVHHYVLKETQ